jgi:fumarate reductase subunit D
MHMNQSTPTSKVSSKNDVESNKLFAALSYLWILSAIFLLFKKDSPFIQFHAKQGLVLFIASMVLHFIPIFGWLLQIVVFAFVVTGIVTAFQGKWFKLPLVSSLAEKINF